MFPAGTQTSWNEIGRAVYLRTLVGSLISWAEHIAVLEGSAAKTHRAEDRSRYQQHLADAALMYAALKKHRSIEKLKELVASERHGYGWGYMDGPEGKAAETAFNVFAKLVEKAT